MAYKNKEDMKIYQKKWYIKNQKRMLTKASKRNKLYKDRNQEYLNNIYKLIQKYNNKETNKITVFGTLRTLMPTILLFAVTWLLIIIGWFIIGIPIGPNTTPTM